MTISSAFLPSRLEEDQEAIAFNTERGTFCQELNKNYGIVKDCLKIREYQRTMMFFLLCGFTIPRFDDFMYYFKTEVVGFS